VRGTVFYKMCGSGNDFIMLDGRHSQAGEWSSQAIAELCDRRRGIGADGFAILTPVGQGQVRMEFWNCDGSRAAMCGNAALCCTRLAAALGLAPAEGMQLVTDAGVFATRCLPEQDQAELQIPDFALPQTVSAAVGLEGGEEVAFTARVGVPHLVVRVADLETPALMARGRYLRSHPSLGPEGANVNFVAPVNNGGHGWRLRTYERGVEAETLACGTGAVAAAVGLAHLGLDTLPVRIQTRGGRWLEVSGDLAPGSASRVRLSGEGRLVFHGVI
jgi:diaminopimelate epimerase